MGYIGGIIAAVVGGFLMDRPGKMIPIKHPVFKYAIVGLVTILGFTMIPI